MPRRKKATKAQVKLGKKERQLNVRRAFEFNEQMRPAERVLLVDDVWTTGETMRAAGQVLKQAGAKIVWGLTLAG
jgi:predicted amidophosphoribosyltransferase